MSKLDIFPAQDVIDRLRAGWVVLEFNLLSNAWIGRDLDGNVWTVEPHHFYTLQYKDEQFNGKWFRLVKPVDLHRVGAEMLPKKNLWDTRN